MKGFTLIEIIITTTVLSIITLIGVLMLSTTTTQSDLLNTATDLTDTVRRAQWHAMHGRNDDAWGVHVEATKFVLFQGGAYVVGAPGNIETLIPGSVSITGISLNGAGSEVMFANELGETDEYGTITITADESGETATVTVNEVGMIERD